MSFLRKRQSRLLCTHPPCHPCASRNPVRLSPPRERPAVPKAPPGEGATVSFLHKQELRLLCTTPRVLPAQAAVQYASPHRGRGRRCPRHRRVRGPQCDSCASRNPVRLSPCGRGRRCPRHRRVRGATVSFLRKQQSSPPLPLRERVASRPGWPGEGATVSFLRKQKSSRCHSCASSSPVRLSPPRERPAVPKVPPGEGAPCHSRASGSPVRLSPPRERPAAQQAGRGGGQASRLSTCGRAQFAVRTTD